MFCISCVRSSSYKGKYFEMQVILTFFLHQAFLHLKPNHYSECIPQNTTRTQWTTKFGPPPTHHSLSHPMEGTYTNEILF